MSDPEVKALRLKSNSTYDYFQQWKKEKADNSTTIPPKGGRPVEVGKITITPRNWGMSLDTYKRVKRDINYARSVASFYATGCRP